jgi:hypothetical protein
MKKYINLNMVLILGLMACEAPVHAGGAKGAKIGLVVGVPVLGIAAGTFVSEKIAEKKAAAAAAEQEFNFNTYRERIFNVRLKNIETTYTKGSLEYEAAYHKLTMDHWSKETVVADENYYNGLKGKGLTELLRGPDFYYHTRSSTEYLPGETYCDPSNPTAPYKVIFNDDGSYTKTFTTDKRMETYDKNGFLRSETFDDGKFDKSYDKNGRLESGRRGNIHRQYFRDRDENLTGYEDTFHGKGYEMYIGNGVIDRDGTVTHTYMDGRPPSKPSIGLTEEDINGTQCRDPNYGQTKTAVATSQKQTDQKINGAAADNADGAGNSQNQVIAGGNNPGGGSNKQPDGGKPESGGDEGGDNSRQGGGDLLLE